jgi:hypothetical protein
MFSRTLLQIRKALASRAAVAGADGDTSSVDLTPAVLNEFINDALQESYNILVERWADYYTIQGASQTLTAGDGSYTLPTDFYKLRKVELLAGGDQWSKLAPHDLESSHLYSVRGRPRRYRMQARELVFVPTPSAAETFRLFYIPLRPELVTDGDVVTFDVPEELKLLLAIAWRECLDRQELDPSPAVIKIDATTKMLRSAADSRDAAEPFYLDPHGPPLEIGDDIADGWW